MKNPLVSVIVRTKDRPKLLKRAIKSIYNQIYRPIEVVLVNDGGCELDLNEIRSILGDISLTYIKLQNNKGRAYAGNVGIEKSKGEYIAFLDDDDEFLPNHFKTLVPILINYDFNIVYSDSLLVYENLENTSNEKILKFSQDFDYDLLIFENYIPLLCLLFRRDIIVNSGGFDAQFEIYEDWDLLIRLGQKNPFYHIKEVTAHYYQWDINSQISQHNRDACFLKEAYCKITQKHIEKFTPKSIHNYMVKHIEMKTLLENTRNNFNLTIKEKENIINSLQKELDKKQQLINALEIDLKENKEKLKEAIEELNKKQQLISHLETSIKEKDAHILAMINTKGWRLLEKYRRIRNRFFRRYKESSKVNLAKKGIKILKEQGLKNFLYKVNKKFLFKKKIKTLPINIRWVENNSKIKKINTRVSVIIPTKNAPDEFEYTLRRISQQEGISEIEIIIIDSGSENKTIEIAEKYTKHIYQIPPEDFHHARTRNFGAEKATGEYLVFTVQDAIPVGNDWLYKLLSPIHSKEVTAVSTIQIPRSDADFYASWSYWAHYLEFLKLDSDRIYKLTDFEQLDSYNKRMVSSLDNVSMAIKKEVFDSYLFSTRHNYAEDLDLGLRLVKDGHALMYQTTNAVIHSHNRPPIYYLKRSYLEGIVLSDILEIQRKNMPIEVLCESSSFVYELLKASIYKQKISNNNFLNNIFDIIEYIRSENGVNINNFLHYGDDELNNFFKIWKAINHKETIDDIKNILCQNILSFHQYLSRFSFFGNNNKNNIEDIYNAIYKIFANVIGTYIAFNSIKVLNVCSKEI